MNQSSSMSNSRLLLSRTPDSIRHAHCFQSGFDIMHANDVRAAQHSSRHGSHRAMKTFVNRRAAKHASEERFSGCADEKRETLEGARQLIELRNQLQILFQAFTKSYARIKRN